MKDITNIRKALTSLGYTENVDFTIKECRDSRDKGFYTLMQSIPFSKLAPNEQSHCSDTFVDVMNDIGYEVYDYTVPVIGRYTGWLVLPKGVDHDQFLDNL